MRWWLPCIRWGNIIFFTASTIKLTRCVEIVYYRILSDSSLLETLCMHFNFWWTLMSRKWTYKLLISISLRQNIFPYIWDLLDRMKRCALWPKMNSKLKKKYEHFLKTFFKGSTYVSTWVITNFNCTRTNRE